MRTKWHRPFKKWAEGFIQWQTGENREITVGKTCDALYYELEDMETAVRNNEPSLLHLQESCDVMEIMTQLRKSWGMKYPGEIW